MKHLLFLLLAFLSTCCGSAQHPDPFWSTSTLVRELSAETVALVMRDSDGDVYPFCTGVWVGPSLILTAAHCANATVAADEAPLGSPVPYIVQSEVTGQYHEPTKWHTAKLVKLDTAHDLALLSAAAAPQHSIAHFSPRAPLPGDTLHFIGHPHTFYYTYMHGSFSATWDNLLSMTHTGPWMQVTAPIKQGMSGGGAFDETGHLVGLCSAIAADNSDMGFYVHLETMRLFVGG